MNAKNFTPTFETGRKFHEIEDIFTIICFTVYKQQIKTIQSICSLIAFLIIFVNADFPRTSLSTSTKQIIPLIRIILLEEWDRPEKLFSNC